MCHQGFPAKIQFFLFPKAWSQQSLQMESTKWHSSMVLPWNSRGTGSDVGILFLIPENPTIQTHCPDLGRCAKAARLTQQISLNSSEVNTHSNCWNNYSIHFTAPLWINGRPENFAHTWSQGHFMWPRSINVSSPLTIPSSFDSSIVLIWWSLPGVAVLVFLCSSFSFGSYVFVQGKSYQCVFV